MSRVMRCISEADQSRDLFVISVVVVSPLDRHPHRVAAKKMESRSGVT